MLYSGCLSVACDEVGIATILRTKIVTIIGKHQQEFDSHRDFSLTLRMPAVYFTVSALLWKKIILYTLPYWAILAAYNWNQMDHKMKIAREVDCLAFTIMRHAGFNMQHDPVAFWKINI